MSAFRPSHCLDYSDLDDHAAFKQHIEEIGACKLAGATKGNRILLQYQTYLAVNSDLNLKPKQVPHLLTRPVIIKQVKSVTVIRSK
jgi:hypothetical protein